MITLRPYQQDGVDAIRAAFRDGVRNVLYCLPTGGGRHVETGYAMGKGKPVVVYGPVVNLFYRLCSQTYDEETLYLVIKLIEEDK